VCKKKKRKNKKEKIKFGYISISLLRYKEIKDCDKHFLICVKAWKYCIRISIRVRSNNPRVSGNYLIQQALESLIIHDLKKTTNSNPEVEVIHSSSRRAGRDMFIFFTSPDLYYERLRKMWEGRWSEPKDIGWPKRKFSSLEYRVWFFKFPSRDPYFYDAPSNIVWRSSADSRVNLKVYSIANLRIEYVRTELVGKLDGDQEKQYITAKQIWWLKVYIDHTETYLRLRRFIVEKKNWKIKKID